MNRQNWLTGPFIGLDTETTGVNPLQDRILRVGIVKDTPGMPPERVQITINPRIPIPEGASEVHGIKNEHILGAWDPKSAVRAVLALISEPYPIVMFNVPYDWTLLRAEAARYELNWVPEPLFLDPVVIVRALVPYRRGKGRDQLKNVAAFYGIPLENAHDAIADITASLAVMRRLCTDFREELSRYSLEEMQIRQKEWYSAFKQERNAYYRTSGLERRINGDWPLNLG